jgi:anti-sigma factor ChrR (cupin superfamily)
MTLAVTRSQVFDLRLPALDAVPWQEWHPGVEIHRLYGDGTSGPAAALLRYAPGAEVSRHEHDGFEHIFVLSGAQRDDAGEYHAGSMVVNPPNTRHRVWSPAGCIVLALWERPVVFLNGGRVE